MGLWERIFGDSIRDEAYEPKELVPGKLRARAFAHTLAQPWKIPCWTFVTDGLHATGQRELSFTFVRRSGESLEKLTKSVFGFFQQVLEIASEGQHASAGELTIFGPTGFLSPRIRGIVYVNAEVVEGLDPPATPRLAGVLLVDDEADIARELGASRMVARLGHASRYYPCPFWSDRDRAPVATKGEFEKSLLHLLPRLSTSGLHLRMDGRRLVVSLSEASRARVHEILEDLPLDRPIALLGSIDPDATACLVALPNSTQASAISHPAHDPDDPRIAGCFLAIAPGAEEDQCLLSEDGFSLILTDDSWTDLRGAIAAKGPFELVSGDTSVELTWTS